MCDSKLLAAVALFLASLIPAIADAATAAPDMPLPPCTIVDGQRQGACPAESDKVSATAAGRFVAGGAVLVRTQPTIAVCDAWSAYTWDWTPSDCYSVVEAPRIVNCATIDLQDNNRFRELPCGQALYRSTQGLPNPMFTTARKAGDVGYGGRTQCGDTPAYHTYVYGGPATVVESIWRTRGPQALECEVTFAPTRRPDGLYGPTWVKIAVQINHGETGGNFPGPAKVAEVYVPIDGDLRESPIDVSVLATHQLEGSDDNLKVTYTATLTNSGSKAASDVEVTFSFPEQVHFQSVSDDRCRQNDTRPFLGGALVCNGIRLEGVDDPVGRNVGFIEVVARIMNASDLEDPVSISARVPDDVNTSNNRDTTTVRPNLRSGSIEETQQAMAALAPYFDYRTRPELLEQQCDVYMNDIFDRLQGIKEQAPAVFANLSFARITSGDYYWAPIENEYTRAGHVGVVVYLKGTNYHETGIVIHGTPTWSPADRDDASQLGTMEAGEHKTVNFFREGTADHGWYYRTPITKFPGSPQPESPLGCGFEGMYSTNKHEFEGKNFPPSCADASPPGPFYPDAVVLLTESPVDILATNSKGQRVETRDGEIFLQELDSGIHSFAEPHEDGTFAWTLVLPKDDYDVKLLGTGTGPYKLTLRKFDADGERIDAVYEGTTEPGQVDDYELAGAPEPGSQPQPQPQPIGGSGGKGGGGSFGMFGLLALLPMLRWRVRNSQ